MLGRLTSVILIGIFFSFGIPSDDIYDQKGYYMFPIRPGEINYLSGSMGELRSTHFHSGIDIKTGGVEGYTVYAAADGFVNRVKISTGGYGKALYIQHPNNTFSVYAHLRDFSKEVADYVRAQQYRKKSYMVDLFPARDKFTFAKGDIIAASGNTGSSTAPHLHFEIRDENHRILDPLRFEFPEIRDSRVPEIRNVAFRALEKDARINGRYGRYDFDVSRKGSQFSLKQPVNLKGKIGVEIYAFDRQDDTNNRYGIPCVEFYQDGELIFSHHIKTFAFRDTRNLLVHTNYQKMAETRRRYHKLYVDDGNQMRFYDSQSRGILDITDTSIHHFSIKLWDVHGNSSKMDFTVNHSPFDELKPNSWRNKRSYRVTDNVLELVKKKEGAKDRNIRLYANRFAYDLTPEYSHGSNDYYLWDLRDGLPDSVDFCGEVEQMNFNATVYPGSEFTYFGKQVSLEFGKQTLFDTLYLQSWVEADTARNLEIFHFDHPKVPLRRNVKISLKPDQEYPNRERTGVYTFGSKGRLNYVGGEWEDDQITFYTRNLVRYTLVTDTIPPVIKPLNINSRKLEFIIEDEHSGIKAYEMLVDGKWVLMNYEPKKRLIWSEKLNENIPFIGELILSVEDLLGNKSTYQTIL